MSIVNPLDLEELHLAEGKHDRPEDGMCVMEAVALMAGESFTDAPSCASPVIRAFMVSWNDALPDDERQQLKRHIPNLIGTAGTPEQETVRAWMATDWLIRVQAPAWLRLAGLTEQADILASMTEVTAATCPSILPALKAVRSDANAARAAAWAAAWDAAWAAAWDAAGAAAGDAAWAAAGDAAWDAAGAAARDAAWAAAWDAARDAAWAAAWAAARDAAWDAAWAAAWDAAGAAARDAAWAAARDAARDAAGAAARDAAGDAAWDAARDAAWAAAWAAARDALKPTKVALQAEAHLLIERMIAVTA